MHSYTSEWRRSVRGALRSSTFRAGFGILVLLAATTASGADRLKNDKEEPQAVLAELADKFRRHCVRVYVNGKSHEGKSPSVGEFAGDIMNERPTLIGGYWWDATHVIIEDPAIHDDFIRSIEVGMPFSDRKYPAKIAGRFVKLQAILLEVLPDDEGSRPKASPLEFADGSVDETMTMAYLWENGAWRIKADAGLGAAAISDDGLETSETGARGVLVNEDGQAIGLAFGERLAVDGDTSYWCGRDIANTPLFSAAEAEKATKELQDSLANAALEVRFHLRVKIDDDDDADHAMSIDLDDEPGSSKSEVRAAGLAVGNRLLFVPLPLAADGIARIENITVRTADGREIKANFIGALRDYMAVVIQAEEDVADPEKLPSGFTMLNPLVVPDEAFQPKSAAPARPEMEYIQRWRIDYSLGRRRESADYDRWLGTFRGYKGDTTVLTLTNEEDGSLAFDVRGGLAAIALTPRVIQSHNRDAGIQARPGFRPLDFVYQRLHASDVFDPALAPVDEDEGRRLVDFGVEYQGLDANTARLFTAAGETRGGRIGLLVTYVYPNSTAAKAGLKEHDILLRLFLEGKSEPVELKSRGSDSSQSLFGEDDLSNESFQDMLAFMPPPWPSRENSLSNLLTAAGVGKSATMEYLRDGAVKRVDFVTAYTDPDYRNAKKEKYPALGLTAKPITYEVARYFRRPDSSGVIISKVEEGGKSSVAGLRQYLLITHVNGRKVAGADDFRTKVEDFEEGKVPWVELTVEGFGKTRLVKIE